MTRQCSVFAFKDIVYTNNTYSTGVQSIATGADSVLQQHLQHGEGESISNIRWAVPAMAFLPRSGWIALVGKHSLENSKKQKLRSRRAEEQPMGV